MTISIWRYSHLVLAVSSFLFLLLASVTGIILTFEPLNKKLQPYSADSFNKISLAESLPVLQKKFPGISGLKVDANQFVEVMGSDAEGKKLSAYIDPRTAEILGKVSPESDFFQWVTAFHRSLFLHEAGRFFIGLTSFLLLLITVSGAILVIKRQRGVKRFFTRIIKENFSQYYHVVLGRLSLIPIFIIALSGTYLSLARFGMVDNVKTSVKIDFEAIRSSPVKNAVDFDIFKNTKLSDVEEIEFPFSEDVEDYFTLKLKDRELAVNQLTGEILGESKYPSGVTLTNLSINLHTGRTNALWAIILGIASVNILFFIYSGFVITLNRRKNQMKNKYSAGESRFIIAVGSENGNTFSFAQSVHKQLLKAGEKSHLTELNKYDLYPKAEYLLVFTATYGLGEAPTNADKFKALLSTHTQSQPIKFSVLGFGSHSYPEFCKFAYEINHLLISESWATPLIDIHTVNDKSPNDFGLWAEAFAQQSGMQITVTEEMKGLKVTNLETLTVRSNVAASVAEGTFMLSLEPKKRLRVNSGDLLAIYPANDHRERLYSIGVVDKQIRLSVRLQPDGLGSGFLHRLSAGEQFPARIVKNEHFYFPEDAPEVIMISNGTGIAPFLGMISENKAKKPCHLYCGFRNNSSYDMYKELLRESKDAKQLEQLHVAFSREGVKQYVCDLIDRDASLAAGVLQRGGVLMICGSLSMQKDIMEILEVCCQEKNGTSISFYQSRNQIRSDCY